MEITMNFSKMADRAIWSKETESSQMNEYYLVTDLDKRVEKALRRAYAEGYKSAMRDTELLLTVPPGTWEASYLEGVKARVCSLKPFGPKTKGAKRHDQS